MLEYGFTTESLETLRRLFGSDSTTNLNVKAVLPLDLITPNHHNAVTKKKETAAERELRYWIYIRTPDDDIHKPDRSRVLAFHLLVSKFRLKLGKVVLQFLKDEFIDKLENLRIAKGYKRVVKGQTEFSTFDSALLEMKSPKATDEFTELVQDAHDRTCGVTADRLQLARKVMNMFRFKFPANTTRSRKGFVVRFVSQKRSDLLGSFTHIQQEKGGPITLSCSSQQKLAKIISAEGSHANSQASKALNQPFFPALSYPMLVLPNAGSPVTMNGTPTGDQMTQPFHNPSTLMSVPQVFRTHHDPSPASVESNLFRPDDEPDDTYYDGSPLSSDDGSSAGDQEDDELSLLRKHQDVNPEVVVPGGNGDPITVVHDDCSLETNSVGSTTAPTSASADGAGIRSLAGDLPKQATNQLDISTGNCDSVSVDGDDCSITTNAVSYIPKSNMDSNDRPLHRDVSELLIPRPVVYVPTVAEDDHPGSSTGTTESLSLPYDGNGNAIAASSNSSIESSSMSTLDVTLRLECLTSIATEKSLRVSHVIPTTSLSVFLFIITDVLVILFLFLQKFTKDERLRFHCPLHCPQVSPPRRSYRRTPVSKEVR